MQPGGTAQQSRMTQADHPGGGTPQAHDMTPGHWAHSRSVVSSIWQRVMAIRLVLPVPDCACAITSRPCRGGARGRQGARLSGPGSPGWRTCQGASSRKHHATAACGQLHSRPAAQAGATARAVSTLLQGPLSAASVPGLWAGWRAAGLPTASRSQTGRCRAAGPRAAPWRQSC